MSESPAPDDRETNPNGGRGDGENGGQGAFWRRVEDLFHQALELPAASREQFVRQRCGHDATITAEVLGILEGYEKQDRHAAHAGTEAGARFGAFEVVRKIGEGGMGAVYLARRRGDFEQLAAIKVIGGTPAAAALMAERFRQERQILAGLEHPNIARLLDGGIAVNGQSYLAMEYVEGERLDGYCEEQHLALRERLQLFLKICAAVHFAHQHLVIHRDLKPANILVTRSGEPKLLDFGIAKVLAGPDSSTERTLTMSPTGLMLTPEYASPEQISGLACTVASDVYSLGVVLYELLTGRRPHSVGDLTPAGLIAAVLTTEAVRPSLAAPENARIPLRGDLDGIVMKALSKQPNARYGSVEQLAADIQRYLDGLPVSAVEGTRYYIARKFVLRHRLAVSAACLLLLSLAGGLTATMWQARVARRERALAEQRFSDARKLTNYVLFPLYDSLQALPGSLPVRADMAAQSLQYLDRLAAARPDDRDLRRELGEGYLRLGAILEAPVGSGEGLGDTAKALESDRKAVAILEPLNQEASDARVEQDLARAYLLLGNVLTARGNPGDGIPKLKQAAAMFDQLAAQNPHNAEIQIFAGRVYVALGDNISGNGSGYVEGSMRSQVVPIANKAIGYFQSGLQSAPTNDRARLGIAQAYNLKANAIGQLDLEQAVPIYRLGLQELERLSPQLRTAPDSRALEARMTTLIGFWQDQTGQFQAALATLEPVREVLDRLAAADPKNATMGFRRVNLYRTLAFTRDHMGNPQGAIQDYQKTIDILDQLIAIDPARNSYRTIRAECQQNMAIQLVKIGRTKDAEQSLKTSIDYLTSIADRPDATPQTLYQAIAALISGIIPALADYRRGLGYAKRAKDLSQGKDELAFFYIAECDEMLADKAAGLEAINRALAMLPPTKPGEKPSRNRLLAEKHKRNIEALKDPAR